MCTFIIHIYVMSTILMTIVIREGSPFSFNEKARLVFSPAVTTNGHSYFGYSLLLRAGNNQPLIIVGAPRETVQNPMYSDIEEPGSIYICNISTAVNESLCTERLLDPEGNTKHISVKADTFNYHDRKDNMWLGMTVGGSHLNNETATVCGPRWINQLEKAKQMYYVPGVCYSLPHTSAKDKRDISKLTPLVDSSNVFQTVNGEGSYHYAYGQAGMSMKLSEGGEELILGAPGTSDWIGSVVRFSIEKQKKIEKNAFKKTNIYTPKLEKTSYFGYSVDSGKFISERNLSYVAGAPRAADYRGKVLLFGFMPPDDILATLEGHQLGEYFGSTLTAVDINQDGLSDLIVGAPLYAQKFSYDQGRVYVYMNKDKNLGRKIDVVHSELGERQDKTNKISGLGTHKDVGNMVEQQALSGDSQTGARFGSSIAAIGDINNDGFIDVAIGAPYENAGMGAVYIYLGAKNGLNPEYKQRVVMEDMRGFGISISSEVDIDQNSCKDLAIGAYESAKAILLRCHPSIKVTSTIKAVPSELSLDSTNFIAKICHKFNGVTKFTADLTVNISVDLKYQSASLANPREATYFVTGFRGTTVCREIAININPEKNDFSRPIVIGVNFDLKNNPMSGAYFCKECVVLRPSTERVLSLRVPFARGCGDDHICQPDLRLKVEVLERTPYVIGTSTVIALNISVENVGESAFYPRAQFNPPAMAPLHRVPQRCRLLDSLLSCDLENWLDIGGQTFLVIELDASKLTSLHSVIKFNITVSSTGNDVTPEDNTYALEIPLKTEAKITVVGDAIGDKNVNFNPVVKQPLNISHTYEINNEGPTSLDIFQIKYYIPIAYRDDKTNIIYELVNVYNSEDDSFSCSMQEGNFLLGNSTDFSNDGYNSIETQSDTIKGSLLATKGTDLPEEMISKSDQVLLSSAVSDSEDYLHNLMANKSVYPLNKALKFSCMDETRVTCLVMNCVKTGGLASGGNGALKVLRMQLNTSNIVKLEGTVILSTHAVALQPSKVFAFTHSLIGYMPTPPPPPTPKWIIIVAIAVGLLLLALISFVLYKFNFFKRKVVSDELLEDKDSDQGSIASNTYNRSTVVDSIADETLDYQLDERRSILTADNRLTPSTQVMLSEETPVTAEEHSDKED